MERDFKADTQLQIKQANERPSQYFGGQDWFHLTPEEELVFDIDRARFPRMITAWSCYEIFMGLLEGGGFNEETKRFTSAANCLRGDRWPLSSAVGIRRER